PREDVSMGRRQRTSHHTSCPYKGDASYWTIGQGPGGRERSVELRDAASGDGAHHGISGLLPGPGGFDRGAARRRVTRTAVVWIESGLRFACVLVFPALAVWAWRAGGEGPLWRLTAVAIGLVLAFAAFAASAAGGNALVDTYGYGYTAPRSLLVHALLLGL